MTIESPYRRGADDGMKFGLYLTAMFAGALFSSPAGPGAWLAMLLMFAAPVVLCVMMAGYFRRQAYSVGFGDLWLDGTLTVIFGTLIASAFLIVYMKWVNPDFVINQLNSIIDLNKEHPDMGLDAYAKVAENLIADHTVPSATVMAANMLVMISMGGIMLSAVLSLGLLLLARLRGKRAA